MRCFSPAKLNLFFRVLGRRADGYHEVASLYQAIDLCDELEICLSDEDSLTCTDPALPVDSSNLVWKAVDLFRRHTGQKYPVRIHLDKKIPAKAGLGGGSGNAATTLWMLKQLTGLNLSNSLLATWAAEIGSDISFFFSEGTAFCTGRGEKVENLPPLEPIPVWLVCPGEGLATPAIFKALCLDTLSSHSPEHLLQQCYEEPTPWGAICLNDLELPAFSVMPKLKELKHILQTGGFEAVCMTGSGSSLFCLGNDHPCVIPEAVIFRANFLNRTSTTWYSP